MGQETDCFLTWITYVRKPELELAKNNLLLGNIKIIRETNLLTRLDAAQEINLITWLDAARKST